MTNSLAQRFFDIDLWLVGASHFVILIASFQVPYRLGWKQDLRQLMPFNFELNLLCHSRDRNQEAAGILEQDFALCREINPAVFARRPFGQKFLEAALRPLAPML